jgi:hypothetical protein
MYAPYNSPKSSTRQKLPIKQGDTSSAGRPATAIGHARRAF